MTLTFTDEQIDLIRIAMCNSAMKHLIKAFEVEEELKKLGREGEENLEMNHHEQIIELIHRIDDIR